MFLFTDKIGNLEPEKSFAVACPFRVNLDRDASVNGSRRVRYATESDWCVCRREMMLRAINRHRYAPRQPRCPPYR
jgi:hypothetical protein